MMIETIEMMGKEGEDHACPRYSIALWRSVFGSRYRTHCNHVQNRCPEAETLSSIEDLVRESPIRRLLEGQRACLTLATSPDFFSSHRDLCAVARGLTNGEIATAFQISAETVKSHVSNCMSKLAVRDRTQLAVSALMHGLINAEEV